MNFSISLSDGLGRLGRTKREITFQEIIKIRDYFCEFIEQKILKIAIIP